MKHQPEEADYTDEFYKAIQAGSESAAQIIVPLLMKLVAPKSVVDIGCGDGTWLAVFMSYGVEDVLGVDGEHMSEAILRIPISRFLAYDLSKPLILNRRFDLALCLEVAEHLPPTSSEALVTSLASAAPVVFFSAAIPGQGGVSHINEQWQDQWAELFESVGYGVVDCVRPRVWMDDRIPVWYRQNSLLFLKKGYNEVPQKLLEEARKNYAPLRLVHPVLWESLRTGTNGLFR